MPEQELEHTTPLSTPSTPSQPSQPGQPRKSVLAGQRADDELEDQDLGREIELVADLVVAASASDGPLSAVEIDRILGVRPG